MPKDQIITIQQKPIVFFSQKEEDYISLTDIAKFKNPEKTGIIIANWLSTRYTLEFMGAWEKLHNPNFNVMEFDNIKNQSGSNAFILSSKQWLTKTKAIGIRARSGRYGGTFAHKDIAFEFASWISAEFKLYLIKEFQRLKQAEAERKQLGWNTKRVLAKINYRIQTASIKKHLLNESFSQFQKKLVYASEADLLNLLIWGKTAQEWKKANSKKEGNLRDYADVVELVVLANLENHNAEFIRLGLPKAEREERLFEIAKWQFQEIYLIVTKIQKL